MTAPTIRHRLSHFASFVVLVGTAVAVALLGCGGENGVAPEPVAPNVPLFSSLNISGRIDLSDVGVAQALAGVRAAFTNYSRFRVAMEDEPTVTADADGLGVYALPAVSPRKQVVLTATHRDHPGFVLEAVRFTSESVSGPLDMRFSVDSTARAIIARALRVRTGRLLDPSSITDADARNTITEILRVIEQHPELLSAATPLSVVPTVAAAAASAAVALANSAQFITTPAWNFLVYQGGDNNLENALAADRVKMARGILGTDVTVLVQIDVPYDAYTGRGGCRRVLIDSRGETEVWRASPPEVNSADAARLAEFVTWAARRYPARHTALILASHGLGWRQGPLPARGIIVDEHSAVTTMGLPSLRSHLLAALTQPTGTIVPLDVIGFDACLMGMVEVAWQLRDLAQFMVASEGNEPGTGWPYDRILAQLARYAGQSDAESLARSICDHYKAFYTEPGSSATLAGTLSVIRMAAMSTLKESFRAWCQALIPALATQRDMIAGLRDQLTIAPGQNGAERYYVQAYEYTDYRDLSDFGAKLRNTRTLPLPTTLADNLVAAIDATVAHRVQFGPRYQNSRGLSIALPTASDYADYVAGYGAGSPYAQLDWPRDTGWSTFLDGLIGSSPPAKVDGRRFAVELAWNTGADLDLYIGEPDPLAPNDLNRAIWYIAAEGSVTPNGYFSADSKIAGISRETWKFKELVTAGRYQFAVLYDPGSTVTAATNARITLTDLVSTRYFDHPGLSPAAQWYAFAADVASSGIVIQEPEPESEPGEEDPLAAMGKTWTKVLFAKQLIKRRQ